MPKHVGGYRDLQEDFEMRKRIIYYAIGLIAMLSAFLFLAEKRIYGFVTRYLHMKVPMDSQIYPFLQMKMCGIQEQILKLTLLQMRLILVSVRLRTDCIQIMCPYISGCSELHLL